MAFKKPLLAVPTTAPFPHSHIIPSTSIIALKILTKLSRSALLKLAQEWLRDENQAICAPYLIEDADDEDEELDAIYPAAHDLAQLRDIYGQMRPERGQKREVVERILEGDWRDGITLYQLAMADIQHLEEQPNYLKWTALKLEAESTHPDGRPRDNAALSSEIPRFHAAIFLRNLQREVGALVKAHYYVKVLKELPITVLRVFMHDTPYSNQISLESGKATSETSRTLYLAFPRGAPFVYVSLIKTPGASSGTEGKNLQKLILDAIPKALSGSQHRYSLRSTALTAKSLPTLLTLRGPGRTNDAVGGWSIFADGSVEETPLDPKAPNRKKRKSFDDADGDKENASEGARDGSERWRKRCKAVAEARFGASGMANDEKGLEHFEVRIRDPFPLRTGTDRHQGAVLREQTTGSRARAARRAVGEEESAERAKPNVRLVFSGNHVFAGIRKLVELGVIDGERMPGWMTGEAAVSVGVVEEGKIKRSADRGPT